MFIYCFDKEMAEKLEKVGYKKAPFSGSNDYSVFLSNNKIKFNFAEFDRNKYKIQNKLNF